MVHWRYSTFSDNTRMIRNTVFFAVLCFTVFSGTPLDAQLVSEFAPARGGCCLQGTAQALADQLQDWNQLARYYADNDRLKKLPAEQGRVVFLGDSITDAWSSRSLLQASPM